MKGIDFMLFKKKEKEITTKVVDARKFFNFNNLLLVNIDDIIFITREKNQVSVNYKAIDKLRTSILTYETEKQAIEIINDVGMKLNKDFVITKG